MKLHLKCDHAIVKSSRNAMFKDSIEVVFQQRIIITYVVKLFAIITADYRHKIDTKFPGNVLIADIFQEKSHRITPEDFIVKEQLRHHLQLNILMM